MGVTDLLNLLRTIVITIVQRRSVWALNPALVMQMAICLSQRFLWVVVILRGYKDDQFVVMYDKLL